MTASLHTLSLIRSTKLGRSWACFALIGLLLQLLLPFTHVAMAKAMPTSTGEQIVICTPYGMKTITLKVDGSGNRKSDTTPSQPSHGKQSLPQACAACLVCHHPGATPLAFAHDLTPPIFAGADTFHYAAVHLTLARSFFEQSPPRGPPQIA